MKKKIVVTKGDIFVVKLNFYQKYFQFLIEDRCQLNGKVIKVFRRKDYLGYKPSLEEIAKGGVDFYSHTFIQTGYDCGYWEKLGNALIFDDMNIPFFDKYDVDLGEPKYDYWHIWIANGVRRIIKCRKGLLPDGDIGALFNPLFIYERIKSGRYPGIWGKLQKETEVR